VSKTLAGIRVFQASFESWCGRALRVLETLRTFASSRCRGLRASGVHVAHKAGFGKARELVQVSDLGDEMARFLVVKALKACRLGQ
jgi:hypothetical protein